MLNIKSAWHTTEKNNIGQADLSTFSIKDTSFSQTVYRAIMWLSNSLLVMCESNKEGTVNVCVCVFDAYFSYISLYHFILTPLLIALLGNPLQLCSSVLRPCFPHVNVYGLSQLHSRPKSKMAAINTLASKGGWPFTGFHNTTAHAAYMALLAARR